MPTLSRGSRHAQIANEERGKTMTPQLDAEVQKMIRDAHTAEAIAEGLPLREDVTIIRDEARQPLTIVEKETGRRLWTADSGVLAVPTAILEEVAASPLGQAKARHDEEMRLRRQEIERQQQPDAAEQAHINAIADGTADRRADANNSDARMIVEWVGTTNLPGSGYASVTGISHHPKQRTRNIFREYVRSLDFQNGDLICLGFSRGKDNWMNRFVLFDRLTETKVIDRLIARNERGENIYISMSPLQPGTTHRTKDHISRIAHIFIERDKDGRELLQRIRDEVRAGTQRPPAAITESSPNRLQVIWTVPRGINWTIEKQEAANKRLRDRYDSDPKSVDAARFLRPAGFRNWNHKGAPFARLLIL